MLREKALPHLIWVIGILIAIIAFLMWSLPNGSDLAGFIAFAASLASLVLATVAIFQSLLFSNSINRSIGNIETSSQKIIDETSRLQSASIDLSEESRASLENLQRVPRDLDALRGELEEQFGRIGSEKIDSSDGGVGVSSSTAVLLKNRSINFAIAIYTLVLSCEVGKYVHLDDMLPGDRFSMPRDYTAGFLEAVKTFEVCGAKIEAVGGNFSVKSIGNINGKEIKEYLHGVRFENEGVREAFRNIEGYFGKGHLTQKWELEKATKE